MTVVVNLYGGPGVGKSSTAAGLFHFMKFRYYKVELVTEYAKDLVYEGILHKTPQDLILKEQIRRIDNVLNKVDYIITDSPILLSLAYSSDKSIENTAWDYYYKCNNLNFFLERHKPYQTYGRIQSENEAKLLDIAINRLRSKIPFYNILGHEFAFLDIFNRIFHEKDIKEKTDV